MKTKSIISTEILHLAAEHCLPWLIQVRILGIFATIIANVHGVYAEQQ